MDAKTLMWSNSRRIALVLISLAFFAGGQPALAQNAQRALGVWADEDGKSNIEIAPCGDSFCGQVVWLRDPNDSAGKPKTDRKNPEESLRSRPLIGLTIIEGLKPDKDNTRLKGRVYNVRDGKTYDLFLKPNGEEMKAKGCILVILCGTQTWTRVK